MTIWDYIARHGRIAYLLSFVGFVGVLLCAFAIGVPELLYQLRRAVSVNEYG